MATILERLRALPPDAPNNLNTKEGFHSFVANALGIAVRRRRCVCIARAVPELVRWCPRCSPSSPQLQSSREQNASATSLSEAPRQPSAGLGRTKCHLTVVGYPSGSQGSKRALTVRPGMPVRGPNPGPRQGPSPRQRSACSVESVKCNAIKGQTVHPAQIVARTHSSDRDHCCIEEDDGSSHTMCVGETHAARADTRSMRTLGA
jgi:hypothetical protein